MAIANWAPRRIMRLLTHAPSDRIETATRIRWSRPRSSAPLPRGLEGLAEWHGAARGRHRGAENRARNAEADGGSRRRAEGAAHNNATVGISLSRTA